MFHEQIFEGAWSNLFPLEVPPTEQELSTLFILNLLVIIIASFIGAFFSIVNIFLVVKYIGIKNMLGQHFLIQMSFNSLAQITRIIQAFSTFFFREAAPYIGCCTKLLEGSVMVDLSTLRFVELINFIASTKRRKGLSFRKQIAISYIILPLGVGYVVGTVCFVFFPLYNNVCVGVWYCSLFFVQLALPGLIIEIVHEIVARRSGLFTNRRWWIPIQMKWLLIFTSALILWYLFGLFLVRVLLHGILIVNIFYVILTTLYPLAIAAHDTSIPSEFATVIESELGRNCLRSYLASAFCQNLFDCYEQLEAFRIGAVPEDAKAARVQAIFDTYCVQDSPDFIYLHPREITQIRRRLNSFRAGLLDDEANVASIFPELESAVKMNLTIDAFPKFLSSSYYVTFRSNLMNDETHRQDWLLLRVFQRAITGAPEKSDTNA